MPRIHHVKSARKNYPSAGIKKGDSYYWWKFRYSSRQLSKTPPRASQLTQSEFLSQVYDLQDAIGAWSSEAKTTEEELSDVESAIEGWISRIHELLRKRWPTS